MTSLTWKLALGLLSAGLIVSQAEAQRWGGRGGSGISIGIGSGWGGSGISVGVGSGGYYGGGYGRGYGGYYGGGRGYYGGGGYGYGRGYGGYYGGYGRGYYGSGGYYGGGGYGYSPYYGGSSYYSSPSYGYSSPSYGYVDTRSYGDSSPTVAANAPVGGSGGTIEIASEAGTQLNYNLNEFPYQIREGQVQRLQEDRPWVIEFHRGGDRGQAAYSLSAGRYKFVETEEGWDLVKAKDSAGSATRTAERLDSRENPLPRTATRPDDLPSTSPATDDPARNVPDLPPGENPARLTPPPPADGNDDDADRRGEGDRAPAGEDRDAGDTGTSSDGGTP